VYRGIVAAALDGVPIEEWPLSLKSWTTASPIMSTCGSVRRPGDDSWNLARRRYRKAGNAIPVIGLWVRECRDDARLKGDCERDSH
jgi:hypothetical protein